MSIMLCLCMALALLPVTALAADTVNLVTLTIEEPEAGKAPASTASLQKNVKSGYPFAKGVTATVNGLAAEILFRAESTMTVKYISPPPTR